MLVSTQASANEAVDAVVIPLFLADRGDLFLSPEALRWAFDDLIRKLDIDVPGEHRALFMGRRYRGVDEVRKALMRYKVFGDLGYGLR